MTIDLDKINTKKPMGRPRKAERDKSVTIFFTLPAKLRDEFYGVVENGGRSKFVVEALRRKLKNKKSSKREEQVPPSGN